MRFIETDSYHLTDPEIDWQPPIIASFCENISYELKGKEIKGLFFQHHQDAEKIAAVLNLIKTNNPALYETISFLLYQGHLAIFFNNSKKSIKLKAFKRESNYLFQLKNKFRRQELSNHLGIENHQGYCLLLTDVKQLSEQHIASLMARGTIKFFCGRTEKLPYSLLHCYFREFHKVLLLWQLLQKSMPVLPSENIENIELSRRLFHGPLNRLYLKLKLKGVASNEDGFFEHAYSWLEKACLQEVHDFQRSFKSSWPYRLKDDEFIEFVTDVASTIVSQSIISPDKSELCQSSIEEMNRILCAEYFIEESVQKARLKDINRLSSATLEINSHVTIQGDDCALRPASHSKNRKYGLENRVIEISTEDLLAQRTISFEDGKVLYLRSIQGLDVFVENNRVERRLELVLTSDNGFCFRQLFKVFCHLNQRQDGPKVFLRVIDDNAINKFSVAFDREKFLIAASLRVSIDGDQHNCVTVSADDLLQNLSHEWMHLTPLAEPRYKLTLKKANLMLEFDKAWREDKPRLEAMKSDPVFREIYNILYESSEQYQFENIGQSCFESDKKLELLLLIMAERTAYAGEVSIKYPMPFSYACPNIAEVIERSIKYLIDEAVVSNDYFNKKMSISEVIKTWRLDNPLLLSQKKLYALSESNHQAVYIKHFSMNSMPVIKSTVSLFSHEGVSSLPLIMKKNITPIVDRGSISSTTSRTALLWHIANCQSVVQNLTPMLGSSRVPAIEHLVGPINSVVTGLSYLPPRYPIIKKINGFPYAFNAAESNVIPRQYPSSNACYYPSHNRLTPFLVKIFDAALLVYECYAEIKKNPDNSSLAHLTAAVIKHRLMHASYVTAGIALGCSPAFILLPVTAMVYCAKMEDDINPEEIRDNKEVFLFQMYRCLYSDSEFDPKEFLRLKKDFEAGQLRDWNVEEWKRRQLCQKPLVWLGSGVSFVFDKVVSQVIYAIDDLLHRPFVAGERGSNAFFQFIEEPKATEALLQIIYGEEASHSIAQAIVDNAKNSPLPEKSPFLMSESEQQQLAEKQRKAGNKLLEQITDQREAENKEKTLQYLLAQAELNSEKWNACIDRLTPTALPFGGSFYYGFFSAPWGFPLPNIDASFPFQLPQENNNYSFHLGSFSAVDSTSIDGYQGLNVSFVVDDNQFSHIPLFYSGNVKLPSQFERDSSFRRLMLMAPSPRDVAAVLAPLRLSELYGCDVHMASRSDGGFIDVTFYKKDPTLPFETGANGALPDISVTLAKLQQNCINFQQLESDKIKQSKLHNTAIEVYIRELWTLYEEEKLTFEQLKFETEAVIVKLNSKKILERNEAKKFYGNESIGFSRDQNIQAPALTWLRLSKRTEILLNDVVQKLNSEETKKQVIANVSIYQPVNEHLDKIEVLAEKPILNASETYELALRLEIIIRDGSLSDEQFSRIELLELRGLEFERPAAVPEFEEYGSKLYRTDKIFSAVRKRQRKQRKQKAKDLLSEIDTAYKVVIDILKHGEGSLHEAIMVFEEIDKTNRKKLENIPMIGEGSCCNALDKNKTSLDRRTTNIIKIKEQEQNQQLAAPKSALNENTLREAEISLGVGMIVNAMTIIKDPNSNINNKINAFNELQRGYEFLRDNAISTQDLHNRGVTLGDGSEESLQIAIQRNTQDDIIEQDKREIELEVHLTSFREAISVMGNSRETFNIRSQAYQNAYKGACKAVVFLEGAQKERCQNFINFYDKHGGSYQAFEKLQEIDKKIEFLEHDWLIIKEGGAQAVAALEYVTASLAELLLEKELSGLQQSNFMIMKEDVDEAGGSLDSVNQKQAAREKFSTGYEKIQKGRGMRRAKNATDKEIKAGVRLEQEGLTECLACGDLIGTFCFYIGSDDNFVPINFSELLAECHISQTMMDNFLGNEDVFHYYDGLKEKCIAGFYMMQQGLTLIQKERATEQEIDEGLKLLKAGIEQCQNNNFAGIDLGTITGRNGEKYNIYDLIHHNKKSYENYKGKAPKEVQAQEIRRGKVLEAQNAIKNSNEIYDDKNSTKEERKEACKKEAEASAFMAENLIEECFVGLTEKEKEQLKEQKKWYSNNAKRCRDVNYNQSIKKGIAALEVKRHLYFDNDNIRALYNEFKALKKEIDEDGGVAKKIKQSNIDDLVCCYREYSAMMTTPLVNLAFHVVNDYERKHLLPVAVKMGIKSANVIDSAFPTLLPDLLLWSKAKKSNDIVEVWSDLFYKNIAAQLSDYLGNFWKDYDGSWKNFPLDKVAKQLGLFNTIISLMPTKQDRAVLDALMMATTFLGKVAHFQHVCKLYQGENKDQRAFWRTQPSVFVSDVISGLEVLVRNSTPLMRSSYTSRIKNYALIFDVKYKKYMLELKEKKSEMIKYMPAELDLSERLLQWEERLAAMMGRNKINVLLNSYDQLEKLLESSNYYLTREALIKSIQVGAVIVDGHRNGFNVFYILSDAVWPLLTFGYDWYVGSHYQKAYKELLYNVSILRKLGLYDLDKGRKDKAKKRFSQAKEKIQQLKESLLTAPWGGVYKTGENLFVSSVRVAILEFELFMLALNERYSDIIAKTNYRDVSGVLLTNEDHYPVELMGECLAYRLEALLEDSSVLLKDPMTFSKQYNELYHLVRNSRKTSGEQKEKILSCLRKIAADAFESYARIAWRAACDKLLVCKQPARNLLRVLDDPNHILRHVHKELSSAAWHAKGAAYFALDQPLQYVACFQKIKEEDRRYNHWLTLNNAIKACTLELHDESAFVVLITLHFHCMTSALTLLEKELESTNLAEENRAILIKEKIKLNTERNKLAKIDTDTACLPISKWFYFIKNAMENPVKSFEGKIEAAEYVESRREKFFLSSLSKLPDRRKQDAFEVLRSLHKAIPAQTFSMRQHGPQLFNRAVVPEKAVKFQAQKKSSNSEK